MLEQADDGKAAICYKNDCAVGKPAHHQLNDLPSPLDHSLMLAASLFVETLTRTQHCKERQRPDSTSPTDLRKQHAAEPTQSTGFDEMGMRRANRIAVDAFSSYLVTAPSLDSIVEAKDERPCRSKYRNQQAEQKARGSQGRPSGSIQDAMVCLGVILFASAHHAQASVLLRLACGKYSSNQQELDVLKDQFGEQGRKSYNEIHQFGRQCEHKRPFLAEKSKAYIVCRCFFKDQFG